MDGWFLSNCECILLAATFGNRWRRRSTIQIDLLSCQPGVKGLGQVLRPTMLARSSYTISWFLFAPSYDARSSWTIKRFFFSSSYDDRSRQTIWWSLFPGARVAEVLQVFASLSRERRWTRASTTSRPLLPPSLDPPSLWTNIKRSCCSFLPPEIDQCFND